MARRRGRPSKSGRRQPNGQLARTERIDRGTDAAQERQDRYGQHGVTALGRAYITGLLGADDEAKIRMDAGKRFADLTRRFLPRPQIRCALDDTPRGSSADTVAEDLETYRKLWEWKDALEAVLTPGQLFHFEQLVSAEYADSGPEWLDRLIGGTARHLDAKRIADACKGLDIIAPETGRRGILARHY